MTAQCPVAALCVVLGGVAAPVVFDAGLVWSASYKGKLGSSSSLFIEFCLDWANLVDLVPLLSISIFVRPTIVSITWLGLVLADWALLLAYLFMGEA